MQINCNAQHYGYFYVPYQIVVFVCVYCDCFHYFHLDMTLLNSWLALTLPSKNKTFVYHLYNVRPTSSSIFFLEFDKDGLRLWARPSEELGAIEVFISFISFHYPSFLC